MAKCEAGRPVSKQRRRHQEAKPTTQRRKEIQLLVSGGCRGNHVTGKTSRHYREGPRVGAFNVGPGNIGLDTQDKLAELMIIAEFAAADEPLRIGAQMRRDSCR